MTKHKLNFFVLNEPSLLFYFTAFKASLSNAKFNLDLKNRDFLLIFLRLISNTLSKCNHESRMVWRLRVSYRQSHLNPFLKCT